MLELVAWVVGCVVVSSEPAAPPRFEAPVRLMAGEKPMGGDRLYPSPVLHDVDGDGVADMVIGDLVGNLTVSKRVAGAWLAPTPLTAADGKPLKFNNW
ncbi:MAG: hypothetical protein AB7O52_17070 [Planctomycetota bacterium]